MSRHRHHSYIFILTAVAVFLAGLAVAPWALSQTLPTAYAADTGVTVGGKTLVIKAGSAYESLTVGESLTVTVPAGEAFELRAPYPNHFSLENDASQPVCRIIKDILDNQLFIRGPRTVTVTPSGVICPSATANQNDVPLLTVSMPSSGESLAAESVRQLFWTTAGIGASNVRIRLSTDGGLTYPTVVEVDLMNQGFYSWTVPLVTTTSQARLKFEGLNGQGDILAVAVSPVFSIAGLEPEPEPPAEVTYDFDPAAATFIASTISADKGLTATVSPVCVPETRIKGESSAAVYYCGQDGRRYVFPNQKTHDTWYGSFAGVVQLTDAQLAQVPIGGNVTYRPGVRLVKVTTDPKVYAVAAGGTLRWVPTEETAAALYGADWNTRIDDVPDAFFVNYTVGEPVAVE